MKDLQAIINNRSAELKDRVFHEVTRRYEKQPRSSSTKAGTFQQMKATGKKTMSREEAEAASEQHKSGREARFGKQDRTEAVIQEQTSEFLQGQATGQAIQQMQHGKGVFGADGIAERVKSALANKGLPPDTIETAIRATRGQHNNSKVSA
jgi:hypothetical protein